MQFKPLTTTTIGSFPRPAWLAVTDRGRATFRLEGEALREAQDDATLLGSISSPTASSGPVTIGRQLARDKLLIMVAAAKALRKEL